MIKIGGIVAVFGLALIFSLRMLGLFMLIPVFSLYAGDLIGVSGFLLGLAFGIYGLTQACLQVPLGLWSDRVGRKPVIFIGLVLFAVGSLVCAQAEHILTMILGRAIQGMGAVGSVLIAFVADVTADQHRTKAMALIGALIGLSFMVAMVLGSLLNNIIGVPGIFNLTAMFAGLGIFVLFILIPTPPKLERHQSCETMPRLLKSVLTNKHLLTLDFGIFCQHYLLMSSFVVLPLLLEQQLGSDASHWQVYLPVMIIAFVLMIPGIIISEKKQQLPNALAIAVLLILLGQIGFIGLSHSFIGLMLSLGIYFTAFVTLEALLPSLISKRAPAGAKGTAMGVYSTSQFFGLFCGGALGGVALQYGGFRGVFIANVLLALIWSIVAISSARIALQLKHQE